MAQGNLTFGRQITLEAFMDEQGDGLDIIKNPKNGKHFWTCGGDSGPISAKALECKDKDQLVVTHCTGENDVEFYLLHKKSTNNTVTAFSRG